MPFPCLEYHGNQRVWTRERVLEGLAQAARELRGPLPCGDGYYLVKKGRLDWPPLSRVWEYFGSLAHGWLAAGASRRRVSLHNINWTKEEDAYLLDHAGIKTLADIGKHLGRSYNSVRARIGPRCLGITARANQGWLSAAEVSRHYRCSYQRVRNLLVAGTLTGHRDRTRNRWQVDLAEVTPEVEALLRAPKRTHTQTHPDLADYDRRNNLVRKQVGSRVVRVKASQNGLRNIARR